MEQEQATRQPSERLRDIVRRSRQRPSIEDELGVAREELSAALARERHLLATADELALYGNELEGQLAALQEALENDRAAWQQRLERAAAEAAEQATLALAQLGELQREHGVLTDRVQEQDAEIADYRRVLAEQRAVDQVTDPG